MVLLNACLDAEAERTVVLIDGFEIFEEIAHDPISVLYRAKQSESDLPVFIRCFLCPPSSDAALWKQTIEILEEESDAQQRNRHPSVEKIIAFGDTGNLFYVASEALPGRTLRQFIDQEGPQKLEWLLPLWTQLANAIDYIAASGIAHTDLSPDTVYLTNQDTGILLRDFVLARVRDKRESPFLAPEQRTAPGDIRSDIYSLGALLFYCLSGKPPFDGKTAETLSQSLRMEAPILKNQPEYVRDILAKLMHKDPNQRYRVAIDLVVDLRSEHSPQVLSESSVPQDPAEGWKYQRISRGDQRAGFDMVQTADVSPNWEPPPPGPIATGLSRLARSLWSIPMMMAERFVETIFRRKETVNGQIVNKSARSTAPAQPVASTTPIWQLRLQYRLGRLVRFIWYGSLLIWIIMLSHAIFLIYTQHYAVVSAVVGKPKVAFVKLALQEGDRLDVFAHPVLQTDSKSALVIDAPETRVRLAPDSAVQLQALAITPRPRRAFDLIKGQAWIAAENSPNENGFEITSAGARIRSSGGRFFVKALGEGTLVSVDEGAVVVTYGASRRIVGKGKRLQTVPGKHLKLPTEETEAEQSQWNQMTEMQEPEGIWNRFHNAYLAFQKHAVLPRVDKMLSAVHVKPKEKSLMEDVKALASAQIALSGLATALMTNGEPPQTLNLVTLEELGLSDKGTNRLLSPFENQKLLAYYHLRDEGYILFARAANSDHTLLKCEDGKLSVIQDQNEDQEFANAYKEAAK